MSSLLLPFGLQVAFFVILILEFIIPSAGILTVISLMCLGGSWVMLAQQDIGGLVPIVAVADLILIPVTLFLGFRLMQKSSLTNRETLGNAQSSSGSQEWVGRMGVAISMLKPSGKVDLDGQILEANSSGDYIEPGTQVRVIQISQNRITVEPVSQGE